MLIKYPVIARNLAYKAGFKSIIENISIALKQNEFAGIIGGSGSGKTTLLTCLNGYKPPGRGEVLINGISSCERQKFSHLIGYVPQNDIVHKTLTVERALYYSYLLRVDGDTLKDEIDSQVTEILSQLDLTDHKNKKIKSLSGGQRKRVSIGVELLHSPRLFFLDEPTAGLDPGLEKQLMILLSSLAGDRRLVVLTTHLMQHIDMFDILIMIHKGHMIYFGPSNEIMPYFQVKSMVELFEKAMRFDPKALETRFLVSPVFQNFLLPRLKECGYV